MDKGWEVRIPVTLQETKIYHLTLSLRDPQVFNQLRLEPSAATTVPRTRPLKQVIQLFFKLSKPS